MSVYPSRPGAEPSDTAPPGEPGPVPGRRTGCPHVVVLGGGCGGLSTVQALWGAPVDITVIDQRNRYLRQPLLWP